MVVKAPDWAYVPKITVPRQEVKRSYTPQLQGNIPVIVMEFLSDTEGSEYSIKPTYPLGKWFFYEQVLEVPNYIRTYAKPHFLRGVGGIEGVWNTIFPVVAA